MNRKDMAFATMLGWNAGRLVQRVFAPSPYASKPNTLSQKKRRQRAK